MIIEGQRIATFHRSSDLSAVNGLRLTVAESEDLLERLQSTVVRDHTDELVAANSCCGHCAPPLARKGGRSVERIKALDASLLARQGHENSTLWWNLRRLYFYIEDNAGTLVSQGARDRRGLPISSRLPSPRSTRGQPSHGEEAANAVDRRRRSLPGAGQGRRTQRRVLGPETCKPRQEASS